MRKLVILGEVMKRYGWYPDVVADFEKMAKNPEPFGSQTKKSPLGKRYPNVHWDSIFQKIGDVETRDYDWSKQVAALTMPVMVVFSDADAVRADHMIEIWLGLR